MRRVVGRQVAFPTISAQFRRRSAPFVAPPLGEAGKLSDRCETKRAAATVRLKPEDEQRAVTLQVSPYAWAFARVYRRRWVPNQGRLSSLALSSVAGGSSSSRISSSTTGVLLRRALRLVRLGLGVRRSRAACSHSPRWA